MNELLQRIKEYALTLYPEMVDNDLLNQVVEEVVDRVLAYTNRQQLVAGYERFLSGKYYEGDYTIDVEGNRIPILPIPAELERTIARIVVSSYKGVGKLVNSDMPEIKSLSDNGQSVTYGDYVGSYFNSKEDSDIFASTKNILDNFRIPVIVKTEFFYEDYRGL